MNLRSLNMIAALLMLCSPLVAQTYVARSEFIPYQLRKDAEARTHTAEGSFIEFNPQAVSSSNGALVRRQRIEVPQSWLDKVTIIHIENALVGYTLMVNGAEVAKCEDSITPSEYDISKYIFSGENIVEIISRHSALPQLEEGVARAERSSLTNSYIYTQSRLRILDYELTLEQLDNNIDGQLFIDVIVENRFNFAETIEVGFDVYDPAGKLLDFSTTKATLDGRSIDTIRFKPYLYGANKFRWNPSSPTGMKSIGRGTRRYSDQMLYSVMIFTKSNGASSNYIPFNVGFSQIDYNGEMLEAWGVPITLNATSYSALHDKKTTDVELRAIRQKGYNTIEVSYPQSIWFYSLCDKIGLYVIEQLSINAPSSAADKRVGGTPSNDPALVDDYLQRAQKSYYRTRNFTCVVAYSLGGESGNGYNMYKTYEWLKSVEYRRPIIYKGAHGEWNDDPLTIER